MQDATQERRYVISYSIETLKCSCARNECSDRKISKEGINWEQNSIWNNKNETGNLGQRIRAVNWLYWIRTKNKSELFQYMKEPSNSRRQGISQSSLQIYPPLLLCMNLICVRFKNVSENAQYFITEISRLLLCTEKKIMCIFWKLYGSSVFIMCGRWE
jgi:hypothetical protein